MVSPEARAHAAMLHDRLANPPEMPDDTDPVAFARLAADMFEGWATDSGAAASEVVLGGCRALWVGQERDSSGKVLLYLHGGGYVLGTADHVVPMLGHLVAAAECQALSVDYRLAPETPFPAALDDAVAAYQRLLEQGRQPGDIVVGGDSAGGGLALAMVVAARDRELPLPAGVVVISPWGDLSCSAASWTVNAANDGLLVLDRLTSMAALYLQGADPADPLASPAGADFEGLPPLYIQASGHETLLDDALEISARAARAGVEVRLDVFPEMQHVFQYCVGNMPEATDAIARIGAWIRGL